ncbi:sodium/sugar symporter [Sphingobacterium rhinopitheci]|uniref:sodium/sugar symporter n=1 Tax=Sphingobacterium rhinopitheci TaxID=2781960 RepID=UPI001F524917|nr:sodium/sugar symporter [Sphingobacterium rhinopitheci]MCI0921073.1 sodium/sugar symporter [Sphingobacterium rhinopitheci]
MNQLKTGDYAVFFVYFLLVALYGYYIYTRRKSKDLDSKDFFLAEGSLTWWAIGASLIASNISAEHFIGMSGSGFALGLAIATYEWMAAATLIIVAVYFIPVYLKNGIYTMPQFLQKRYNNTVSTVMAVFWLLVYVFVNLTSIIYLGALAISSISTIPFTWSIVGLSISAVIVTLGGMKVIGYTDVIQVFVLILGGLVTTYLALNLVSEHFGYGNDILKGLVIIKEKAPLHFEMIFDKSNLYYRDLPGLSVLIGGMWINNLNYWGCNQYIVQRALGADLKTARKGILFAAFLKLLIPIIAVLPGIIAFVLYQNGMFQTEMKDSLGVVKPDHAYPTLLNLLPEGIKGLAFAALVAAIISSLAGQANSISTIFSLDIYHKFFDKNASEKKIVRTGRWTVILSLLIASVVAPALSTLDQAYQFIQEYVGFISPGVLAIFLFGFFWRRTTSAAALTAALLTIPLSVVLKFLPVWTGGAFPDYPFLDRMSIVFVTLIILIVIISLLDRKSKDAPVIIEVDPSEFRCSPGFIVGSVVIVGILTALYTVFW